MIERKTTATVIVTMAIFGGSSLLAQGNPDQFYPRDYVQGHELNKPEVAKPPKKNDKPSLYQRKPIKQGDDEDRWKINSDYDTKDPDSADDARAFTELEAPEQPAKADEMRDIFAEGQGIPVQKVDLVVNAIDQPHFNEKVGELVRLSDGTGVRVGTVYAVGNLDSVMNLELPVADYPRTEEQQPLFGVLRLGGHPKIIKTPPKELNINLSPAWLLHSADGMYVIEATGKISKHFNRRGQLVVNEHLEPIVK